MADRDLGCDGPMSDNHSNAVLHLLRRSIRLSHKSGNKTTYCITEGIKLLVSYIVTPGRRTRLRCKGV